MSEADAPAPSSQVLALKLPFDDYELSVDEIYYAEGAQDLLVERCMEAKGFEWSEIERPKFGDWRNRRRYGVIEKTIASRYGYHSVPEILAPTVVAERREQREKHLSPNARAAALEDGKGCWETTYNRMWDGIEMDQPLFNKLSAKGLEESQETGAVSSLIRKWSDCMKGEGFAYSDPYDAATSRAWSKTKKPSTREIRVAEGDVACKRRTNLVSGWVREESKIQLKYIRDNEKYFSTLRHQKRTYLQRARSIIETHGRQP
ncbi:hypothetical protein [Streptomyces iconiensis]|uniref:Uncharacterized protein n=1 Tax=Streptomyces iconiensis TaxID=1384038 RepID=A0ABT6ZYM3_9ACTN|nr:hypothetical protein [Streptomyces iconiensis]MDJ1134177.1 hypothetical protein [Streptomyces iconiensis]